mmetsp:Transcript_13814/g.39542  ORF Transcript_13814/g.39542 Transcript_13814/m.39542 type:complete len:249 (-) Transcript_13814:216-962(-)
MAKLLGRVIDGINADINDHAARLQPGPSNKVWLANGSNNDVCSAHVLQIVLGARVQDLDCGVHRLEQRRHGHADDVGAAQDHRVLARDLHAAALEQLDAARRRAGDGQRRLAAPEAEVANVHGRKAIGILLHLDLLQHSGLVDVARQWQLHKNRMDLRVVVELPHLCEEICLAHSLWQRDIHAVEVALQGGLLLHPHVRLRVFPLANKDHRQARLHTMLLAQFFCCLLYLRSNSRCDCLAINQLGLLR